LGVRLRSFSTHTFISAVVIGVFAEAGRRLRRRNQLRRRPIGRAGLGKAVTRIGGE
jgi:hypothetical protein